MTDYFVSELEAFCKGTTLRGDRPGIDYHTLAGIARFKSFKKGQDDKLEELEKQAKKG